MSRLDRVVFDIDTTPPTIPVLNTPVVIDTGRIDLSWNASTDTGGSGLAGYEILKDGTITIPLGIQLSYSDTGNAPSSTHTYRVRAKDANNNFSQYSTQLSGTTQSGGTGPTASAEADWVKRSTAPGVVWAHDFRSQAEVTNFLFPGSDTNKNRWRTDDGITGGCYEAFVPAGDIHGGGWERPFSPLNSGGNGLSVGDVACNGTLTRKTWTPSSSQLGNWADGYYCHPDYLNTGQARDPGPASAYKADNIPGRDFYIQFRVKMPASRFAAGQPDGKLVMILTTGDGPIPAGLGTAQPRTLNQELVIKSNPSALYQMYTNFGNRSNSYLTSTQGASGTGQYQPGADYGATCVIGNTTTNTCWSFPADEWVTVLVRVNPGHDGGGGDQPVVAGNSANDTGVEVWVARANEWEYTKIWDKKDYVWSFGQTDPWPRGFNSFAFNAFMNQVNATQSFYHRYCQDIFSRQFVQCPQPVTATVPTWAQGLSTNTVVHLGSAAPRRFIDIAPPANLQPAGYDLGAKWAAWTPAVVDPQLGEWMQLAGGGHTDGSGNDVLGMPLRVDVPAARRITNPSLGVDPNDVAFDDAGYADGKIRSYHGWNLTCWGGRAAFACPEGTYSHGWRQTRVWRFDKRSLDGASLPVSSAQAPWSRRIQPMPDTGGNIETQGGGMDWDPVSWQFFRVANQGSNGAGQALWSWHRATEVARQYAVTLGSVGNGHANWMCIAYDLRVGVIGMQEGYLVIFNPDDPVGTWVQKSASGTGAYGSGTGSVYHPQSRKIICHDHGENTVRYLTVPTNPFTGSWAWSSRTFGGATISPTTAAGSFSKFNRLDDIGNGKSLLIWGQTYTEGLYVVMLDQTGP